MVQAMISYIILHEVIIKMALHNVNMCLFLKAETTGAGVKKWKFQQTRQFHYQTVPSIHTDPKKKMNMA